MCRWLKKAPHHIKSVIRRSENVSIDSCRNSVDIKVCASLRRWNFEQVVGWLAFYEPKLASIFNFKAVWSPFKFQSKMNFGPPIKQVVALMQKHSSKKMLKVADIGCGTGLHAIAIAESLKNASVFASEPSLDMFKHLCFNVQNAGLRNISISMSDLSTVESLYRNQFDAVFSFRMAHFADCLSLESVYRKTSNLLKKSGFLLLQEYIIPNELTRNEKEAFCESITRAVLPLNPSDINLLTSFYS